VPHARSELCLRVALRVLPQTCRKGLVETEMQLEEWKGEKSNGKARKIVGEENDI